MMGRHSQFLPILLWLSSNQTLLSYYLFKSNNSPLCYCFLRIPGYLNCSIHLLFNTVWILFLHSFWFPSKNAYIQQTFEYFWCSKSFVGNFCQYFIFPSSEKKLLSLPYDSEKEAGALRILASFLGVVTDRPRTGIWLSNSTTILFPLRRWSHRRWQVSRKM